MVNTGLIKTTAASNYQIPGGQIPGDDPTFNRWWTTRECAQIQSI